MTSPTTSTSNAFSQRHLQAKGQSSMLKTDKVFINKTRYNVQCKHRHSTSHTFQRDLNDHGKSAANGIRFNILKWPLPVPPSLVCENVFEQQYTSCMKVGNGRNLGLSREYPTKLFGPMFYSWWNCPLSKLDRLRKNSYISIYVLKQTRWLMTVP